MLSDLSALVWLHLPHLLSVAALALRNQLQLRVVLLVSVTVSAVADIVAGSAPDFQDLFWNVVSFLINLIVIVKIAMDSVNLGLSREARDLYSSFSLLTPGEFRALLRLGTWATADQPSEITREGVRPDCLYYVLHGDIVIEKSGRTITIPPRTFIGEIAYLHRRPASATVRVAMGGRYVAWPLDLLDRQTKGRDSLKHAVLRLISADMAKKVASA